MQRRHSERQRLADVLEGSVKRKRNRRQPRVEIDVVSIVEIVEIFPCKVGRSVLVVLVSRLNLVWVWRLWTSQGSDEWMLPKRHSAVLSGGGDEEVGMNRVTSLYQVLADKEAALDHGRTHTRPVVWIWAILGRVIWVGKRYLCAFLPDRLHFGTPCREVTTSSIRDYCTFLTKCVVMCHLG
jgi:hypothetical protein